MIKVLVFAVCDFISLPNGGEVMLLNNFLSANNNEDIEYYLVGMSFSNSDVVGRWGKKKIGNNEYNFLPVTRVLIDKEKTRIPFRLRVTHGIKKYWKIINSIGADYCYIHSAELGIPVWGTNIKLIYHVHGDPCQTLQISRFPLFRLEIFTNFYWKIIERTIKKSSRIIWAADRSKQLYLEKQPQMGNEVDKKSVTIHSSFDTKLIPDFRSIPKLSNRKHLVTVGRLSRVKRIDFLLDVVARLVDAGEDIDFLICGDGEEMQSLKRKAHELNISDRVVFLGLTNRVQTASALAASDVFVFASENEAMSLVVLESLYMGTPVVSTNVGDISYVVKDGKTGFVVDDYNAELFANKISAVIAYGREHYSCVCSTVAMKYTPERMANSINEVFNEIDN